MPFTQLYTAAEVAATLRTGPSAVNRLCRLEKIRASKVNGSWRISEEAIREYLGATENTREQDVA